MTTYQLSVTYTPDAWSAWLRGPHSCAPKIEAMLARLGGRLVGFWWAAADFDSLLLVELPDEAALASFRGFALSLGGIAALRAMPLLADEAGIAAIARARGLG